MHAKRADFAGSWYPGGGEQCRSAIGSFLDAGLPCPGGPEDRLGGIVPHAGWMFSGKIACNVIRCLAGNRAADTCIIFGRHLRPGSPNFIMTRGKLATPLGDIDIDEELADALAEAYPFTVETASRYEPDNTIELQLPFIRYFFPRIRVVPLGLPPAQRSLSIARTAADKATALGRKCIVLGSTDLTHYGYNYGFSPRGGGPEAVDWVREVNDKRVIDLILAMDGEGVIRESLENCNACCGGAAAGAVAAAEALGAAHAEKIAYATSYDVRPDSSFVGYVGIVFS